MVASKLLEEANFSSHEIYCQSSLNLCSHPHPKIRYAALELMEELIDTHPREYEEMYLEASVELLVNLISDPIVRVSGKAMTTLITLAKTLGPHWVIANCIHRILPTLFGLLQKGIPFIQQMSMKTLSVLSAMKGVVGTNAGGLMEVCRHTIEQMKGK